MKVVFLFVGGVLGGALLGSLVASSNTCCQVVANGVRGKFPASVQAVGDVLHIWPATVGLANFG